MKMYRVVSVLKSGSVVKGGWLSESLAAAWAVESRKSPEVEDAWTESSSEIVEALDPGKRLLSQSEIEAFITTIKLTLKAKTGVDTEVLLADGKDVDDDGAFMGIAAPDAIAADKIQAVMTASNISLVKRVQDDQGDLLIYKIG